MLYYYENYHFMALFEKKSVISPNVLGDKVIDHFQVPVPSALHPVVRALLQLYSTVLWFGRESPEKT